MINSAELNRTVLLRQWSDVPNVAFGTTPVEDAGITRRAKIAPVSGVYNWGTKQVGTEITHRIWVRYGTGTKPEDITGAHVVEYKNRRYRVKRVTNWEDAQRFTMIEVVDLGNIV
jgi:head-tail adaptor